MLSYRFVFLFALLFLPVLLQAMPNDTIRVITHDNITVVTDPSKGRNSYNQWGVFPSADVPVRKITMRIQFACPDSMRCADWDYLDHIRIKRTGGVDGAVQDYEIGRMLTPYGGAFGKDWEFDWQVDVTDFRLLLKDSVEIEYEHTGWEPNEDRGWKVKVEFEVIKGQPAYQAVSIQKIYDGAFRYGDESNSIDKALVPVHFTTSRNASMGRFRIIQTGHGMDRPDGCGEFCNKYREFWFDEQMLHSRAIWKECGDNPLYPQAGTWIFDRANWCPGDLVQPDIYDIPLVKGKEHSVQLKMENYDSPDPSADELIAAYLIQYGPYQSEDDVAIEDIIVPSGKRIHGRLNPAGFQPRIVIKNNGGKVLEKLQIRYGNKGQAKEKYKWSGHLLPGKTDTLQLEGLVGNAEDVNVFQVELRKPNNKKDAYLADNRMSSNYQRIPEHEGELVFFLHTNNKPGENAYSLTNSKGEIFYQRTIGSLEANTTYRDTLKLPPGSYQLQLTDTTGNGLEFWYHVRDGRGRASLLNSQGQIIRNFDSDFGNGILYNFRVGSKPDPIAENTAACGLFPTRTKDTTTFDFISNTPERVKVQLVTDPGQEIEKEHIYEKLKEGVFTYDLSQYPKGRFYFKVYVKDHLIFNKRVRLKE
jgi:hypothetical protein